MLALLCTDAPSLCAPSPPSLPAPLPSPLRHTPLHLLTSARPPALQIFSTYGFVQKIHIFEREGRTVALVQYTDVATADTARGALQGHAMYDGGHNVVSAYGGREERAF